MEGRRRLTFPYVRNIARTITIVTNVAILVTHVTTVRVSSRTCGSEARRRWSTQSSDRARTARTGSPVTDRVSHSMTALPPLAPSLRMNPPLIAAIATRAQAATIAADQRTPFSRRVA